MAGTVVSMAMPLVTSAISMSTSAANQEMRMLIDVNNDIWYIRDELKTIQAFLRSDEVTKEKDELVKVWAKQVKELAYGIEDCLQEFAIHMKHRRLMQHLMKIQHSHRIAIQIKILKLRVEEVSNRNMRYSLIRSIIPSSTTDDSTSNMELTRYCAAHYVDEAELVGFDGPKKDILDMISSRGNVEARPIWIVGAGGVGKTTLAKKVYENRDTRNKFQCHAWITVSQSFDVKELLKDMIKQFLGCNNEEDERILRGADKHILIDMLKKGLEGKSYFLVLDDLWSIQAWDCLKPTSWENNMQGTKRNQQFKGVRVDSLEVLGTLPKLMLLRLRIDAYVGEKLEFQEGAFPILKKLDIGSLEKVKEMRFEQGTSPRMEMIEIYNCSFESGIIGIEHLPMLKEISLG
ncbi:hypothetical protein ABZP36_018016 [Zizania latifolia]